MNTKYKLEQTVWFMCNNQIKSYKIHKINQLTFMENDYTHPITNELTEFQRFYYDYEKIQRFVTTYEVYTNIFEFLPENVLFATKEELIENLTNMENNF